ncbi:unnamed protein product [Adineta steineri]|uniref:N-acetylmuramoyl-L-alanine amidase n=3 Tax=Adineta steineri TaxID=433720 RepID=A0A813XCF9_9BILA|nr:unnamed protein product [Adineta steineri]CAF1138131.1 unnamed protein product [Adineta steineri]CAF4190635.1 unnamed protein product [Adineta steineri]
MIACVAFIYVRFSFGAECWSSSACIDAAVCAAKGGIPQKNLCNGAANIQCCSCANCMNATLCASRGGIPSTGICPGSSTNQCCDMASTSVPIGDKTPVKRMLTDLADILRNAELEVVEVAGWTTRGHGQMTSVKSIICHHTAGAAKGDFPSLSVVRDGRTGDDPVSGPLAQLGLGRTGKWYVIAAGISYHAGVVTDNSVFGNSNSIGIEAEATGLPLKYTGHDHWPEVQYQSYIRGVKALQAAYGVPTARVVGHKEVAAPLGRKPDPNFPMDEFRTALEE